MSEILPPVPPPTEDVYRPIPVYVVQRRRNLLWLHILLLVLTIGTTLIVGARMQYNFLHDKPAFSLTGDNDSSIPFFQVGWIWGKPSRLLMGIPFASTLMLILLAHEMGHYLTCRYYGVQATLPFFIPAPTLIGTLGAFIRIRSPIRSRAALFDIGIAGPIAGFIVALAVLFFALPHSKLLPAAAVGSDVQLGYPAIFRLAWYMLPLPQLKNGTTALHSIYFHPTAVAAWVGMFATALNLLPGGQLDGGHIVFAIAPRAHRAVSRLTIFVLFILSLFAWSGWLVWAILLRITGMRHPMVAEWPGITGWRRWAAVFALLMLVLTFAQIPLQAPGSPSSLIGELKEWHVLKSSQ
jgi:membrane-associated protease RseP (regulator of RpoE activity)